MHIRAFVVSGAVVSLFVSTIVLARTPTVQPVSGSYQESVQSFRKVKVVNAPSIVVPTVVEFPLNTGTEERNDLAVFEDKTSTYIPYYLLTSYDINPEPVSAYTDNGDGSALVDGDSRTNVDFMVVEDRQNSTTITLSSVNPVESSSLVLELDQYVALPTRVTLSASLSGEPEHIVVAPKSISGSTITFPKTTATLWTIILEYAQPLRINELRLVQDAAERSLVKRVRFLAQPQSTYKIFHDADRSEYIETPEAGNLYDDTGVLKLPVAASTQNEGYREADVDQDGVVDMRDNCVQIANTDQADIDQNGRGDMCDDFDRDGIMQQKDNCPNNPNVTQEDADGVGDVCDTEENRITEKYPWVPWAGMGIAVLVLAVLFVLVGTAPKGAPPETLG